jgi:hypothetical protein
MIGFIIGIFVGIPIGVGIICLLSLVRGKDSADPQSLPPHWWPPKEGK